MEEFIMTCLDLLDLEVMEDTGDTTKVLFKIFDVYDNGTTGKEIIYIAPTLTPNQTESLPSGFGLVLMPLSDFYKENKDTKLHKPLSALESKDYTFLYNFADALLDHKLHKEDYPVTTEVVVVSQEVDFFPSGTKGTIMYVKENTYLVDGGTYVYEVSKPSVISILDLNIKRYSNYKKALNDIPIHSRDFLRWVDVLNTVMGNIKRSLSKQN